MKDPRVRKDGKCVTCKKPKPVLKRSLRKYAGNQYDRDPFCSSRCCRRFHGCELANDHGLSEEVIQAREEAGRRGSSHWRAKAAA